MDAAPTNIRLFCGNANVGLARRIAEQLGVRLGRCQVMRLMDGETCVEITDPVQGSDVFLLQPLTVPINEHLMELLFMIDACKRAGAGRITAVVPYLGYGRQSWTGGAGRPNAARLVADMLTAAGTQGLVTVDLPTEASAGLFNIPVRNLRAAPALVCSVKRRVSSGSLVVVSPDAGGVARARWFAKELGCGLAFVDYRNSREQRHAFNVVGDVEGMDAILVNDVVDNAVPQLRAALALKERGVGRVYVAATHGVFSGSAVEYIEGSPIVAAWVTDSCTERNRGAKVQVVSISGVIAEAIRRVHGDEPEDAL